MGMSLHYLHYDVFTDIPLLGNQLAVFPDARDLSTDEMQAIAREFNFSETTFVLPPEQSNTDVRMRIFTPYVEMPMAGHPTIGSTFALAATGAILPSRSRFVFGLNVGPTPVDLEWDPGGLRFAWMTQAQPVFGPAVESRTAVAAALGLSADDLVDGLPVQEVSCGVPYLMVPIRDRAAVDRAVPHLESLQNLSMLSRSHPAVFLFADEGIGGRDSEATAYSRMFAPGFGVVEDPATGSASGPLGCYLVQHGRLSGDAANRIVSIQGVKMGRASRIYVSIAGRRDRITDVKVGGEAVLVARGEFLVRGSPAGVPIL